MLKCYFFMNLFCEPFPCICFMYLYCILIVFVLYSSVSAGRSIGGERSQTQTLSLNLTSPWHLYLPWNLHSNFSNYTNRNYTNTKIYFYAKKYTTMTSLSLQLFIPVNNSFPLCFRLSFSFECYISRWGVFNIGATSLMSTF